MPPLVLFAARGLEIAADRLALLLPRPWQAVHLALVVLVVLSAVAETIVLFELPGEFSAA